MNLASLKRRLALPVIAAFISLAFGSVVGQDIALSSAGVEPSMFRIGEKLSYSVSYGRILNAAYAEMQVVSRGALSGRDAVELRSKVKTLELVNAAFFQLDESRTVFAAPDTGLPLFVTRRNNMGALPKESSTSYLKESSSAFDFLTLLYKVRAAGGVGTFPLYENEKLYTITFRAGQPERVKTDAGQFDTIVAIGQSDMLETFGIKELRINLVADEHRVPALIRMKTDDGVIRASLLAIQFPKAPVAVATPAAVPTPRPAATVRPSPSPTPYINDQPLAPELGFQLGESLEYNISQKGVNVATITLEARERRLVNNQDSLILSATVTRVEPGSRLFVPGDSMQAVVDPETLAPRSTTFRAGGELSWLNHTVTFDPRSGAYSVNGRQPEDAPMGTHTLLSLIYAMRSFNLRPSKDPNNPVNDTRVSVFFDTQPYIFVLRPANPENIAIGAEKVSAQLISFTTGSDLLDKRSLRVWLGALSRVPVRFALDSYQADLVIKP